MFFSKTSRGNTPAQGQLEPAGGPDTLLKEETLSVERRQVQRMLGGKSGLGRYRKWTWLICSENMKLMSNE